jgi:hypothetical protein
MISEWKKQQSFVRKPDEERPCRRHTVRMTRLPRRRRMHSKVVLTPVEIRLLVARLRNRRVRWFFC